MKHCWRQDPRSEALKHIVNLLPHIPTLDYILLENVQVGERVFGSPDPASQNNWSRFFSYYLTLKGLVIFEKYNQRGFRSV